MVDYVPIYFVVQYVAVQGMYLYVCVLQNLTTVDEIDGNRWMRVM